MQMTFTKETSCNWRWILCRGIAEQFWPYLDWLFWRSIIPGILFWRSIIFGILFIIPGILLIIDLQQGHPAWFVCCVVWFVGVVLWRLCCWLSWTSFEVLEAWFGVSIWLLVFASVGLAANTINARPTVELFINVLTRVIRFILVSTLVQFY